MNIKIKPTLNYYVPNNNVNLYVIYSYMYVNPLYALNLFLVPKNNLQENYNIMININCYYY